MRNLVPLFLGLTLARCACPSPEPPPLRGVDVGTIIGEAFVDDGEGRTSVGGAVVRVLGLGVEETTVENSKFVLEAIPVGEHEVVIEHRDLGRAIRFKVTIESAFQTIALDPAVTTLARAATVRGQVVVDNPVDVDVFLIGGDDNDVTRPGDDGSFTLLGVPSGPAQIAFSKDGFDLAVVDVSLSEGDNDLDPVTLVRSTATDLPLTGSAQLVGGVDHRGITVRLNDGAEVATTEQSGAFSFAALTPGRYKLTASKPGFRTATLPTVALNSSGAVFGLVPIFLQPGEDPPPLVEGEVRVEIVSPTSGAVLLSNATTAFDAIVDNANPGLLTWTVSIDGGAPSAVGSGTPVVVTLPNVNARAQVDVFATLPDGFGDTVTFFVDPLVVVPPVVDMRAPVSGAVFTSGTQTAFDALVQNADASTLAWSMSVDGGAETAIGAGTPLVFTLPDVSARTQLDITARLPDGTSDSSTIFVDPLVQTLTIASPSPGDILVGGTSMVLDADVENANLTDVTWALRVFGDTTEIDLGSGVPRVAPLPEVVTRESYEVVARLPNGTEDSVVVFVDPSVITGTDPFVPGADALVAGVAAQELFDQNGVLIGSRYVIQEGQPITIEPTPGLSAVFSDGTQAFNGSLPLRDLPVGTHTFTATFTTADGQSGTSVVEVEVQPLVFNVAILAPTADGTFFDDTPIQLNAQIVHGFQTGFLNENVSWRNQNGTLVASGALTSVTLPAGPSVLTLEVVDVVGNVRTAIVAVDVVTLTFTAFFNAPANGASILQGQPLRINVGFNHNRLSQAERDAVFVHVISDRVGRIVDDTGANEFAPDADIIVSSLPEGRHVLTARVFAAGRIATATVTINVDVPFVSSVLLSNIDVLAVPGQPLAFELSASGGNGAVPLVHWFLDGVEFDPTWAGYGTDAAAASRQRMDFGVYDPNTFPFTDPRWFEGPHSVEAWVRTSDVDFNLGCIDQGVRAQCHTINLEVARAPIIITSNLTLTNPATPEVWSGVVQLQAEVLINGGKLIILPGTQVLVDMRSVADPNVAVTAAEREIILQAGTLEIGAEDASPVVIETIKSFTNTPRWNGIHQGAINANERNLRAFNTTLRDAALGLTLDNVDLVSGTRQLILDGFTVESSTRGILIECATTLQNIALKAISGGTALQLQHQAFCPGEERVDGLAIESTATGVDLGAATTPTITTIDGADIQGAITRSILVRDKVHLILENSRLSGNTNGSNLVAALSLTVGGSAEVYNCDFDNNSDSVSLNNPGPLGFTASGTRFRNTNRAFHMNTIATGRPFDVHACTFENANNIMDWQFDNNLIESARFEGNFLGDPALAGTVARALATTPTGIFPNVPRISDARDTLGSQVEGTTRIDNPLPTAEIPLAVIIEPQHMHAYNGVTQCIPAIAHARDRGFDAVSNCTWRVGAPGGAPGAANEIVPDADGCLAGLADGEHAVHLVCSDGVAETVHSTRLLVDSTRYAGRIHPRGETWSGNVLVDGDIIVPTGATLTLQAGTTVRFKDTDRTFTWRPQSVSGAASSGKIRGFPTRVDVHVEGTLEALGEPDNPVILEAESGIAPARWGSIALGGGNPTVRLHNVIVRGADSVMASNAAFAPANSPIYDLDKLRVEDSNFVYTGLCPNLTENLDTLRNAAIADCGASAGVTFSGGNWLETRGGAVTAWVHLLTQTGGALIQPTLENIVATGSPTSREVFFQSDGGNIDTTLSGVDVDEVSLFAFQQSGSQRTFIDGSIVRNFGTAVDATGSAASLFISNSAFEDGGRILFDNINVFSMTNSRATRVAKVFEGVPRVYQVMEVTGSQFEGVGTVFDLNNTSTGASESATFNFTGNNFIGTTTRVLLLRGVAATNLTTIIDMQGNHWDTTDPNVILTLVEDPRTDADPNDTIEGRTDFTGFTATPVVVTTP